MNKLEVLTLNEKDRWNEIVKSFSKHEVFYLPEYVEAYRNTGDGEPLLFYYNDCETRAINVVMKRDISTFEKLKYKIPANTYFDFSSPYGYGGFIIEGENYKEVNNSYNEYCRANSIVCEFVRFNLFSKYQDKYDGTVQNLKHNVIRPINMSPEEMLMDFEHKVRKNIKRAIANNLKVEVDINGEKIDDFLNIYYKTMDRNSAEKDFYYDKAFFNKINEMKDNVAYFNVIHENKAISTELIIYNDMSAYSYLGGTLSEYFNLRPNDFIKYEIIKWLYDKKISNFVLGGGYGREDGLSHCGR